MTFEILAKGWRSEFTIAGMEVALADTGGPPPSQMPEPTTLLLFGLGAGVSALALRRKRA